MDRERGFQNPNSYDIEDYYKEEANSREIRRRNAEDFARRVPQQAPGMLSGDGFNDFRQQHRENLQQNNSNIRGVNDIAQDRNNADNQRSPSWNRSPGIMPPQSQNQDAFSNTLGVLGTASAVASPFIPYAGLASGIISIGKGLYDNNLNSKAREKEDTYRKMQGQEEEDYQNRLLENRRGVY